MVRALATLPFIVLAPAVHAQPIEIQADQFEMLLDERRTTYTGNVSATQGERIITAAELIVEFNDDNEITAMRASGAPAELSDAGRDPALSLKGTALDYDFDASVVRADGGGTLSRGGDTIAAEHIVYDLNAERARALGRQGQRVKLKLEPAP